MASATIPVPSLLSAEEFAKREDSGTPEELVRGTVVVLGVPDRRHGQICGNVYFAIRSFVENHD